MKNFKKERRENISFNIIKPEFSKDKILISFEEIKIFK